jgi:hypothetical protein
MPRRVLDAISILSLVVAGLTLFAWLRSLTVYDEFHWVQAKDVGRAHFRWHVIVQSGSGGISVSHIGDRGNISPAAVSLPTRRWEFWGSAQASPKYPETLHHSAREPLWGFHFHWSEDATMVLHDTIVPYWFLALATAVLPALRARRWRGRRRERCVRLGLCGDCGYDLRASERQCPECGAPIERRAA